MCWRSLVLLYLANNILVFSDSNEKFNKDKAKDEVYQAMKKKIKTPLYAGENFPSKYLNAETVVPTNEDLNHYISSLAKTMFRYFARTGNDTDVNRALGTYFMRANLRRTLQDYGDKLHIKQVRLIKDFIEIGSDFLSHFIYSIRHGNNRHSEHYRKLFIDDREAVFSLGKFKRNKLKKYIHYRGYMNDFIAEIDAATLPRDKYVDLIVYNDYFIHMSESDHCISMATFEPVPANLSELRQCYGTKHCRKEIFSTPSVGYNLSHRMLNIFFYRGMRRCYLVDPDFDAYQLKLLCAFMYREAVYIARRGFFSRDLFLEHVALCGLLGYEEFFRRNWFYKATTWIDEEGCVAENYNHEVNRTRTYMKKYGGDSEKRDAHLEERCYTHQMALMVEVLATAIRHAAHYVTKSK